MCGLKIDGVEKGHQDGLFHELVNFSNGWVERFWWRRM
jgi:hypothetical protein